jgi:hypothetical protein
VSEPDLAAVDDVLAGPLQVGEEVQVIFAKNDVWYGRQPEDGWVVTRILSEYVVVATRPARPDNGLKLNQNRSPYGGVTWKRI